MVLVLLLSGAGCSDSSSVPVSSADKSDTNVSNSETLGATEPTANVSIPFNENEPLFVCQDRADIEGDSTAVYYYNYKGDLLDSTASPQVGFYSKNGLAPACDPATDLIGFVDKSGVFVIEPQWNDAAAFSDDGIALVVLEDAQTYDKKYGFINDKGEEIAPCIYDEATSFYPKGFAIVGITEEMETIFSDENGEPYSYIVNNIKLGVIDKTGKVLIEPKYKDIEHIAGDYIVCSTESAQEVYDLSGNMLADKNACYIDETHSYEYHMVEKSLYRYTREILENDTSLAGGSLDYRYTKIEVYNGSEFIDTALNYDPNKAHITARRVATTSTGYGYGVCKGEDTLIPFEYEQLAQYGSFYIGIKYKNGNPNDQTIDIYNEKFEKTAENLNYNFLWRTDLFGNEIVLPDGYFEVYCYDDELYGVIDSNGSTIIPPLYDNRIILFTYEGAGGKFTY